MAPNFRDEHPDRYGPIFDGDYAPIVVGEHRHFVKMTIRYGIVPDEVTACGLPTPDWRENPAAYPICGIVDCPRCLELAREES